MTYNIAQVLFDASIGEFTLLRLKINLKLVNIRIIS